MKENKTKPDIRFKGFTEAWEQRKVSKITKFHKQGFYTIEDYNDNKKYYLLRGTDFSENKLLLKDTPKINATKKDYEAFKTELGDFLIVRSGTVGTYGIVDVDIPAIFGSYLIDFRFDMEQVTNEFFGYFYQSDLFKSQLNKIIQTSANTNINAENIKSTVISLPNLDEQRKISEYLGNLDHLITLHQRECDQLKELKKSMLKKMFPRDESSIPEVRFAGFTDAWEQRKLRDEAIEILAGGDIDKEKTVENGKYPIYANALTNDGIVGYYDDYYRVTAPAVTVTGRGEVGYAKARMTHFTPVVRLLAVCSNHDCYFLENAINNHKVVVESTGVPQLTVPQLSSYNIFFPANDKEEVRIGKYFHTLDNLITLHQRELEILKNLKKTCLKRMFI